MNLIEKKYLIEKLKEIKESFWDVGKKDCKTRPETLVSNLIKDIKGIEED